MLNCVNSSIIGSMCFIKIIINNPVEKNIKDDTDSALGNEYWAAILGNERITIAANNVAITFPNIISFFIRYTRIQVDIQMDGIKGAINNVPPSDVANPLPPLNCIHGL